MFFNQSIAANLRKEHFRRTKNKRVYILPLFQEIRDQDLTCNGKVVAVQYCYTFILKGALIQTKRRVVHILLPLIRDTTAMQFTVREKFFVDSTSTNDTCTKTTPQGTQWICCSTESLRPQQQFTSSPDLVVGMTSPSIRLLAISSSNLVAPVQRFEVDIQNAKELNPGNTFNLTKNTIKENSFLPLLRFIIGKSCAAFRSCVHFVV